jgi:hypothetical protein
MYLKCLLNCVLLRSDAFLKVVDNSCVTRGSHDDTHVSEDDDDDDDDDVFNNMETVEDTSLRKKCKLE